MWDSLTQSSGTLTITNASAEKGGVVDLSSSGAGFGDVVGGGSKGCFPRFHMSCLMDFQRLTWLHVEVASIQIPTNAQGSLNSEVSR